VMLTQASRDLLSAGSAHSLRFIAYNSHSARYSTGGLLADQPGTACRRSPADAGRHDRRRRRIRWPRGEASASTGSPDWMLIAWRDRALNLYGKKLAKPIGGAAMERE